MFGMYGKCLIHILLHMNAIITLIRLVCKVFRVRNVCDNGVLKLVEQKGD